MIGSERANREMGSRVARRVVHPAASVAPGHQVGPVAPRAVDEEARTTHGQEASP